MPNFIFFGGTVLEGLGEDGVNPGGFRPDRYSYGVPEIMMVVQSCFSFRIFIAPVTIRRDGSSGKTGHDRIFGGINPVAPEHYSPALHSLSFFSAFLNVNVQ
jgi:hypothetical protein